MVRMVHVLSLPSGAAICPRPAPDATTARTHNTARDSVPDIGGTSRLS